MSEVPTGPDTAADSPVLKQELEKAFGNVGGNFSDVRLAADGVLHYTFHPLAAINLIDVSFVVSKGRLKWRTVLHRRKRAKFWRNRK